MAHKDYVARGRASKKAPPPPPKSLPWLRLLITVSLIAGFGYLLWSIKDKAETAPSAEATVVVEQSADEDALPILEEEEWEFIKTLPTTSVEVEVAEQEKSDKRYVMQCASFRLEQQAQEMKAKIAFLGLVAQVRASEGKNGLWYKVILGPYDLKRSAEKDRHTIRRSGTKSCRIWYWNL